MSDDARHVEQKDRRTVRFGAFGKAMHEQAPEHSRVRAL